MRLEREYMCKGVTMAPLHPYTIPTAHFSGSISYNAENGGLLHRKIVAEILDKTLYSSGQRTIKLAT